MHPDLPHLLTLQSQDLQLMELANRRNDLFVRQHVMDRMLEQLGGIVESAKAAVARATETRVAAEQRLETLRGQQERKKAHLEQESNPRVATQLLADLETGRGNMAQEEADWLRLAEVVSLRENEVAEAKAELEKAGTIQQADREAISQALQELEEEIRQHKEERERASAGIAPALRERYERMRRSRKNRAVVVPVERNNCTSCHTSIPSSQVGPLHANGILVDGCQMCGAILYLPQEHS